MKKVIFGICLTISILAIALFTGCIGETESIEGSVHNQNDFKISVDFSTPGEATQGIWVAVNSTEITTLEKPNTYTILAKDYDGNRIGTTTLTLDEDDSTFTITVDDDSVTASSS